MSAITPTQSISPAVRALLAASQRNAPRLRALACLILAALLGKLLAQLIWALMPLPASAAWRPLPAAPKAQSANAGPDLRLLAAAQLFGQYQAAPASTDALASAPDTQLNLTLLGIFAGDKTNSRALIASSENDEKPYGIGDTVVRGTVLQAIFPDRVVLARGARLETLRLDKDRASADGGPVVADSGSPPEPGGLPQLSEVRSKLLSDPSKVSDYIRINPVSNDGEQHGYRVFPGKDRALFGPAGLRPGDVVTSVNGVELDDPARGLQLLGTLAQASEVTVVVERAGQSQTLRVSLSPQ